MRSEFLIWHSFLGLPGPSLSPLQWAIALSTLLQGQPVQTDRVTSLTNSDTSRASSGTEHKVPIPQLGSETPWNQHQPGFPVPIPLTCSLPPSPMLSYPCAVRLLCLLPVGSSAWTVVLSYFPPVAPAHCAHPQGSLSRSLSWAPPGLGKHAQWCTSHGPAEFSADGSHESLQSTSFLCP